MKYICFSDKFDATTSTSPSLPGPPSDPVRSDFEVERFNDDFVTRLQQCYQIQDRLQTDLLACDARFSLFVAAATSYNYQSLLRPFPKEFNDSNQRPDIEAIFEVVAHIDRLESILELLIKGNYSCHRKDVLRLLHSVLVRHGERVALRTLRQSDFKDLYAHLNTAAPQIAPTHIFEVTPSLKCTHTNEYTHLREQYPVRIGFYGGQLEQLYAMLTVGCLPANEPLELVANVDEAFKRSPHRPSWGGSRCGAIVRFVAVVEYVVMPEHVSVLSATGRVIIRRASCMQISYLMFFGQSFAKYESELVRQSQLPIVWNHAVKWMVANKYAFSVGIYLMAMSVSSSGGRGIFHRFASTGLYMLRKGLLKI